ncbi:hypothetical protein [Thermobifida cellulosilytica]|uniref:Antitoxin HicB n=1 Tax=Thermobifida cellulosilytica TB100 TaxID=665004 RepID=A0A147KFI1_THECS|nr:hypothetical protein [Thermobifida cellulosilytica]KUP96066.1 hypothetical protein AC529_14220 [Thermobifida cellulosilytica TB100]
MALYEVRARKWENGWELRVPDVGVTWSPTLGDAPARAREFISAQLDREERTVHVDLQPHVSEELDQLAVEARRALHIADEAVRTASAKLREIVQGLSAAGLPLPDVAQYLGVPQQRLEELLRD